MIKKFLNLIKRIGALFDINIQVTRFTSNQELKEFLKNLYPVKINKELIRVGSRADGGYIISDDLKNIEALFSPGVGSKQDFDLECANRGMKVFMADASVEGPVVSHSNFVFTKKFIGALDNQQYMSIENWIKNSNLRDDSDLILQMDIEGYEYETIYSIPKDIMQRFRIILIEFHELNFLLNKSMFEKFKNSFLKILQTHYCVHIHPNNCCKVVVKDDIEIPPVLEFTFIRKDRVKVDGYVENFPNILDVDCAKEKTLKLPKCWYKH
jgi:hypothetical protein